HLAGPARTRAAPSHPDRPDRCDGAAADLIHEEHTMTPDIALDHIRQALVQRIGVPAEQVVPEAKLRDDLEMDSLDMVELITLVEDELGHNLEVMQLEDVLTVGDVVKLIVRLDSERHSEIRA